MMELAPLNKKNKFNTSASFIIHVHMYIFKSPNNICFACLW